MQDGGQVELEAGFSGETIQALLERGHHAVCDGPYGGSQAIMWDGKNGIRHGASEGREDGQAAAY